MPCAGRRSFYQNDPTILTIRVYQRPSVVLFPLLQLSTKQQTLCTKHGGAATPSSTLRNSWFSWLKLFLATVLKIRRAGPFGGDHCRAEGCFGGALFAKGGAIVRFLEALHNLTGDAQRRLFGLNRAHVEAFFGVESIIFRAQSPTRRSCLRCRVSHVWHRHWM